MSAYAALPDELAGWRWSDNPKNGHVFLMHPKRPPLFTTRHYPDPEKAIAEAKRWVLSQPKPKETPVTTNTLATINPVIVGVPMMDESEARQAVTQIRAHFDGARKLLLDLDEREGWRALGYSSWRDCAQAEFGQSVAYLYRQLAAAKIEQALDSPIGEIPESHLRPLAQLDTPEQQRQAYQVANADGPATAKKVQQAVDAERGTTPDDLRRNGVQLTKHGSWFQATGFSGVMNGWTSGKAEPWDLAVHAAREEIAKRTAAAPTRLTCPTCGEPILNGIWGDLKECGECYHARQRAQPAPDLADILKRLDAHGYARTTTRQKGSTTYHSFRDYSGRSDELGGELELPEGELSFWLSDLDAKAQRAQERQALFLDAQARFGVLGWTFERDGTQFRLSDPQGKLYATTNQLDSHLRTLQTFEAGAAKRAAAAEMALTIEELDSCMPKTFEVAGYYWKSAQPIVIAHNDGWTGTAGTIATAITLAADREKARKVAPAGEQQIISRWTADEVAAFAAEADQALQTLDTYRYTTIAAFVRQTYTLLLDKEPAPAFVFKSQQQPTPAHIEQQQFDASPLDPIRADVEAIGDWLMIDGWTHDQTRAKLTELGDIRRRLDLLADAPDVLDDDYDSLSKEIGELEVEIAGLLPAESEASV